MDPQHPLRHYGLVHLVLYQAVMRPRHTIRSVMRLLGSHVVTATCLRGKRRPWFEWTFPRYSPAGTDVGGVVWRAYMSRLPEAKEAPVGVFSNAEFQSPLEYTDIMTGCRAFLPEVVDMSPENTALWSTYSARRALPSAKMTLQFDEEQKNAAGHWLNAKGRMSVLYSATRAAASTTARLTALEALWAAKRHAKGPLTWETLEVCRHQLNWPELTLQVASMLSANVVVESMSQSMLADVGQSKRFDLSGVPPALKPSKAKRPRAPRAEPSKMPRLVCDSPNDLLPILDLGPLLCA